MAEKSFVKNSRHVPHSPLCASLLQASIRQVWLFPKPFLQEAGHPACCEKAVLGKRAMDQGKLLRKKASALMLAGKRLAPCPTGWGIRHCKRLPSGHPQVHEPACGAGPFSRLPCMCIRTLGTLACLPSQYGRPAALSVCACARGRRTGKRVGKRVHLAEHRHDFLMTPDKAP